MNKPGIDTTPWDTETVSALNRFQEDTNMHSFTCGGDHPKGHSVLVATRNGFTCPVSDCMYEQKWFHDFMLKKPRKLVG